MSKKMRFGVIGGGSVYTPELIEQFAKNTDIIGEMEINLMDIDKNRLQILYGFSNRLNEKLKAPMTIHTVDTYEEAIDGADFVLLQFRAGGVDARIEDEKLGLKYRLPFTETISVCGASTFLRTYPIIEELASVIQKLAPDAWVTNFTNPAGQLTEALSKLGCNKIIGICNNYISQLDHFCKFLGAKPEEILMEYRGLNHLTFMDAIYYNGRDVFPEILDSFKTNNITELPYELMKDLNCIPNNYLQYYYTRDKIIDKLQKKTKQRSEEVKDLEVVLLKKYSETDQIPDELRKRGGYGYSRVAVGIICNLLQSDKVSIKYANVKNNSIIPELPEDAFVEIPIMLSKNSVRALAVKPIPDYAVPLIVAIKKYDRILIQAAMERSKNLVFEALLAHPLIPSYDVAKGLTEDILELNKSYIPIFR